ncbi:MAG: recombinase family protein [Patescibacteria group bacterium]
MSEKNNYNSKRAVIYSRVSTSEQADEGNSLITQEKDCRKYASENGYEIPEDGVFIERGESAKTADRTQLQKLLMYCSQKKNQISAVIIYKIDRLSRNTDDYSQLRLMLKRFGVSIRSATELIEDTPLGKFMENTMANVAQFDNDVRSERCSNGMREAMREGRYVWGAPVGYSNGALYYGKATIAQNGMAPMVRRVFEVIATGLQATDEVWRQMCAEGLQKKNGKPVSRTYFPEMLRNELYMGWINKFGERHKGTTFEPIVSEELFAQVQRVLKNKGHKVAQYKTDNPDFPLRRFISNPLGIKLTGSWAKGRSAKYPFYRFGGKGGNYARDEFEKQFSAVMDSYRFENNDIEKLKRFIRTEFNEATKSEREYAQKLKKMVDELSSRQTALIQKNLSGVLSDAVLKEQLALIDKETLDAQAILTSLHNTDTSPEEAIKFAERYLAQPSVIWRNADIATKTKLQWFQFPSGVVFDGHNFGTTEVCSVFKAKELILSPMSSDVVFV